MKSDIITLIPAIQFDTDIQKVFTRRNIKEFRCKDSFTFGGAHIFSYKKFKDGKVKLPKYHSEQLSDLHKKIIDGAGNLLEDYAIIYEKNLTRGGLDIKPSDAEELLSYFAYRQNITNWVPVGTLKIECMHGAGRIIHVNNAMEHFSPKYDYLLPIEQDHKTKIRYSNAEETLTKVLDNLRRKSTEEYARLFRAIRFYNSACRNELGNRNSSIVLLVAGLEALFDYSPPSRKEKFAYAVKVHLGFSEKAEIWAEEFYNLRSHIVHGAKVTEEDLLLSGAHTRALQNIRKKVKTKHLGHIEIAKDTFDESIFIQLENMGIIKMDFETKQRRIDEIINRLVPNIDKVESILSKKEYTFDNFKKEKKLYKQFLRHIELLTMTDYSASKKIKLLINKICSIAKDWFEKDVFVWLGEVKKNPRHLGREHIDSYERSSRNIYDYLPTLNSANFGHDLRDPIFQMLELCRQRDPIMHSKDEFRFIITEFLERSLRALFGTYQIDIGKGMPSSKMRWGKV